MTPPIHLAVDGLAKAFTLHVLGGKQICAIRDVSFEVRRGAFVGLIGLSGSGKSTLLKCLYRTYLASAGSATYVPESGEPVDLVVATDDRILELRRGEMGYVSQHLRPTPRVTAVDLVARPLVDLGQPRDDAREAAAAMLRRLDIPPDLLDGYPALFSGGEQQRVNVARALVARRSLLLLDEPTSALDTMHQQVVIELLREAKRAGTTIIGVFHDLDVLRQLADTYVALRDGVVSAGGVAGEVEPEALLAGPVR